MVCSYKYVKEKVMQKEIDLKKLSLVELKSLAYDLGSNYNLVRRQLEVVNNEIQVRVNQPEVIDNTEKEVKDGENTSDNESECRT